ncbi:MAG: hypothetical protein HQM10_16380 [Candidatus Riflebacteria bacterium]|nr:hypothetical protein [Candidatus Riflebacteria bacterium]
MTNNSFVSVSRFQLIITAIFFPIAVILLMWFFFTFEFEVFFAGNRIALKAGGTRIDFPEFRQIHANSSPYERKLSEYDFALLFSETLIWAESARLSGYDQSPEFKEKVRKFDSEANFTDITRSVYLLEELAEAAKEKVGCSNVIPETTANVESGKSAAEKRYKMLHLRTILVKDEQTASQVIELSLTGTDFKLLNERFSISNYAPVGGDMGFVTEDSLPENVFAFLAGAEHGKLIRGYVDNEGIHFFIVQKRSDDVSKFSEKITQKSQAIKTDIARYNQKLKELQTSVPVYISPLLKK